MRNETGRMEERNIFFFIPFSVCFSKEIAQKNLWKSPHMCHLVPSFFANICLCSCLLFIHFWRELSRINKIHTDGRVSVSNSNIGSRWKLNQDFYTQIFTACRMEFICIKYELCKVFVLFCFVPSFIHEITIANVSLFARSFWSHDTKYYSANGGTQR